MIGIRDIGIHIPVSTVDNLEQAEKFSVSEEFVESKLGITKLAKKSAGEKTSDLCCRAFEALMAKSAVDPSTIELLVVCTQNPDYRLPHTSAIVHGKLGIPEKCVVFDISLGCSGYVYGLSIVQKFMESSGLKNGLFFTADPYSPIIDPQDKNTSLLFGDAATVSWLNDDPIFACEKFTFGTRGGNFKSLICEDRVLSMNGRDIFNFAATVIPDNIRDVLALNRLHIDDVDYFLIHQGSKFIVDFIVKKMGLPKEKVPFGIRKYGNTVSSSIPILLQPLLADNKAREVLMVGFGVGLSWASGVISRR